MALIPQANSDQVGIIFLLFTSGHTYFQHRHWVDIGFETICTLLQLNSFEENSFNFVVFVLRDIKNINKECDKSVEMSIESPQTPLAA